MPPPLALALGLLFAAVLIARDVRVTPRVSHAMWIPLLWMTIICSRSVTEWIYGEAAEAATHLHEGSPVDMVVYLLLILAGSVVLLKRSVSLSAFMRQNVWIGAFFIFGLLSVTWSEFPFVAFKRWYKVVGHVVMVLVVFSEEDPEGALAALLRRCSYFLSPLSVIFIKYYPHLGRTFSVWTGEAANTGVTTNKNLLGVFSFVMVLAFLAQWIAKAYPSEAKQQVEKYVYLVLIYINGW
jgi:exopolysaccharide production protein ExoQ